MTVPFGMHRLDVAWNRHGPRLTFKNGLSKHNGLLTAAALVLWATAAAAAAPSGGGSWLASTGSAGTGKCTGTGSSTSDIANAAISTTKRMHQLLGLNPIPHTETM